MAREELCCHVASARVLASAPNPAPGHSPLHPSATAATSPGAASYATLLHLGRGSDGKRCFARDVASDVADALKIMTSEAAAEVLARLLAMHDVCACVCVCVCVCVCIRACLTRAHTLACARGEVAVLIDHLREPGGFI